MTPVFGTAAVLVAPSAPILVSGYVAGNSLAAQHYNWMWYHLTKELNNLLTAAGVVQNTLNDSQLVQAIFGVTVLSSGSPYSLAAGAYSELIIKANPYTVNLPAATGSGNRVKIVDAVVGSSLVTITPNGTDKIGPAGNVSIFLQNNDQGQNPNVFQNVELLDALAGYWVVTGGIYAPHQTVDTDGSQLELGKLHHLPLGNTTLRLIYNGAPPTLANWSAAMQVSGATGGTGGTGIGVPTGAKAVRAKIRVSAVSAAGGNADLQIGASDNNSNVPLPTSSHPIGEAAFTAAAISNFAVNVTEVDIPLNGSGQFYIYTAVAATITIASSNIQIAVVGYYMGD
jgi:hypothetical protein